MDRPVRVERTVLAVAEIAGGHDAEGADGGERANLQAVLVAVTWVGTPTRIDVHRHLRLEKLL